MRLSVCHAVAVETPRGWRITKAKQSHKIDVVVALAMACWAAVSIGANADLKRIRWHAASDAGDYGENGFTPNKDFEVRSAFGSVVYTGNPADDWHAPRAKPANNTDFLRDGSCNKQQR